MRARKAAAAVVAAALVSLAAQTATAQESGSFQESRSYRHGYISIEHGGVTYTGGPATGTKTIIQSSGSPFVVGASSVAQCLAFSTIAEDGLRLEAACADTDTSGDVLYAYAFREQGSLAAGGGGDGWWEIRGGTGKYEGITGSCTYRTEYLDGSLLVSLTACTWSRS